MGIWIFETRQSHSLLCSGKKSFFSVVYAKWKNESVLQQIMLCALTFLCFAFDTCAHIIVCMRQKYWNSMYAVWFGYHHLKWVHVHTKTYSRMPEALTHIWNSEWKISRKAKQRFLTLRESGEKNGWKRSCGKFCWECIKCDKPSSHLLMCAPLPASAHSSQYIRRKISSGTKMLMDFQI